MIVGDFCLKKNTTFQSWLPFVRIFIYAVTMAAAFYNQSTLYYNRGQTSSLSFAFIPLVRSEWAAEL